MRLTNTPAASLTGRIVKALGPAEFVESVGVLDVIGLDPAAVTAWCATNARSVDVEVIDDDTRAGEWAREVEP